MNIMLGKRVRVTCNEWAIIARFHGSGVKGGIKDKLGRKKEGFTLRYVVNKGKKGFGRSRKTCRSQLENDGGGCAPFVLNLFPAVTI